MITFGGDGNVLFFFLIMVFTGVCACMLTQLCLTLCDPMDCSPPGSFLNGICQARILELFAISFSRTSS